MIDHIVCGAEPVAEVLVRWASLAQAHHGLVNLLDAVERSRLEALDLPADRARFLLGTALLRGAAAEATGLPPAAVGLSRACDDCGGAHGRPRVAGGPHLTLSHSGVLVVVASCWSAPVGVDVQRSSEVPDGGAHRWVRDEARRKAGREEPRATVVDLAPPLAGYAAALAVLDGRAPRVRETPPPVACPTSTPGQHT